jgi:hypothetical protein
MVASSDGLLLEVDVYASTQRRHGPVNAINGRHAFTRAAMIKPDSRLEGVDCTRAHRPLTC